MKKNYSDKPFRRGREQNDFSRFQHKNKNAAAKESSHGSFAERQEKIRFAENTGKTYEGKYLLLDSGNGRKLEIIGSLRLIRPALNAFWKPTLPESEWNKADAEFRREPGTGGGIWTWKVPQPGPEEWTTLWGGVFLAVKPTNFGHVGFFAEQAPNWEFMRECVKEIGGRPKTLNLFAYSGGATIAMAQAGAETVHLDASNGIIEWAKKNQSKNPASKDKIRWICDDAMKFVAREERRGSKYSGIVLDPPSFGRGAQGQVWKIEESISGILQSCRKILDLEKSCFLVLSCHSQGFSPVSLGRILAAEFPEAASCIEYGEMTVPETDLDGKIKEGKKLPAGMFARFFLKK